MKKTLFLIILLAAGCVFADNMTPAPSQPQTPAQEECAPAHKSHPSMMEMFTPPVCAPEQEKGEHKQPSKPLTMEQVKADFSEFMGKYMKGYDIKEINTVYMPFGPIYQATVGDKAGNKFYLDINPEGKVRGPIVPRQ